MSSSTERMQRHRDRARRGATAIRLEISPGVRRALVAMGWSGVDDAEDPARLADDVEEFLEAWAEGRLAPDRLSPIVEAPPSAPSPPTSPRHSVPRNSRCDEATDNGVGS